MGKERSTRGAGDLYLKVKQHFFIFLTILLFAVGNIVFTIPNLIMNGGLTGLSQIGYYLYEFNIGLSIFLLNIPLFITAFFFYKDLFYKSAISMAIASLLIGLLQDPLLEFGIHNIWIGSIAGGLWMGIALGILARMNSSLGGGSLLGKMLHERFGISLTKAIFFIDVSVYPLSLFLVGVTETIFSLVLTFFSAFGVFIVTRSSQEGIRSNGLKV
ncbi:YitT family protein [Neobacillus drentensis]|uniref:YitT family protein n=1 Tax=Neobacillus drentensis TaxID=220684 RepID=UPI002FFF861F